MKHIPPCPVCGKPRSARIAKFTQKGLCAEHNFYLALGNTTLAPYERREVDSLKRPCQGCTGKTSNPGGYCGACLTRMGQ